MKIFSLKAMKSDGPIKKILLKSLNKSKVLKNKGLIPRIFNENFSLGRLKR